MNTTDPNNLIIRFLSSPTIDRTTGPTQWHFQVMEEIVKEIPVNEICPRIVKCYKENGFDRHQAAWMLSILIWHSPAHNLAERDYFEGWAESGDEKIVGLCISKNIEWFPFGNALETLNGIKRLKKIYPQFKEDYDYWEQVSNDEIELRSKQKNKRHTT